mmetsp:Transcript_16067/g.24000  ORF Transcript_16067/g.24000 Transcript_16067/m.24000 type:complete len:355 (+) Transcript_16067:54-1118(+)
MSSTTNKKPILVCGGAGYIGSHIVIELAQSGFEPIIFDNVSTGFAQSVDAIEQILGNKVVFIKGDICCEQDVDNAFKQYQPVGVVHLCAFSQVGESVQKPLVYYQNNVGGMMTLLKVMKAYKTKHLIFSSTAAVFGIPDEAIAKKGIDESVVKHPISPYGETKLTSEQLLASCANAWGDSFSYVALRYFNAAGAHASGLIGESHQPESHLIPLLLQVANNQREKIFIFGDDYPTPDGTCIRDYIHVTDLATAHVLALNYLMQGGESDAFNLGNGQGYSVKQVIETTREVTKHPIPAEKAPRRAGDPAVLITNSEKAKKQLEWKIQYPTLKSIIASAWKWSESHKKGYGKQEKNI